jgi:hypothetical protein
VLAAVDLDHLHATAPPETLLHALSPLFELLKRPCPSTTDEDTILRHLHTVLDGHPVVNLLLKETAGAACSLEALAQALFHDHPLGRKAVEVLITLGAIARRQKDEPGLMPTRVHAMLRGLHALYACLNPCCLGRQDAPGKAAVLGKLFAEPRTTCDACGSRIFELASCRSCGSPYLYTYANEPLAGLSFLWAEMEGVLEKVELLPTQPRYQHVTEEVRVHLRTGYLDRDNTFPNDEVRSLWVSLTSDGDRQAAFDRCAMCQPPTSRQRSRISDFRTKGE